MYEKIQETLTIPEIVSLKFQWLYWKKATDILENKENQTKTIDWEIIVEKIASSFCMIDWVWIIRVLSENSDLFYVYIINRNAILEKNYDSSRKQINSVNDENICHKYFITNKWKKELLRSTNSLEIEFEWQKYKPSKTEESWNCYFDIKTKEIFFYKDEIVIFMKEDLKTGKIIIETKNNKI